MYLFSCIYPQMRRQTGVPRAELEYLRERRYEVLSVLTWSFCYMELLKIIMKNVTHTKTRESNSSPPIYPFPKLKDFCTFASFILFFISLSFAEILKKSLTSFIVLSHTGTYTCYSIWKLLYTVIIHYHACYKIASSLESAPILRGLMDPAPFF